MIKVDIKNRMNLTLLAKAYLEDLLPKGMDGEIFYDHDDNNEIKSIYYKNHKYFDSLLEYIKDNKNRFMTSNSSADWNNLFTTLLTYTTVDKIDYGLLDRYGLTLKNDNKREIDLSILDNNISDEDSFLTNMRRLYNGYDVTYWGKETFVVVKLPYNPQEVLDFDLTPIVRLAKISKKNLLALNIYTDSKRELNVVRVEIENLSTD